jgi:hypothetical protein
MGGGGRRHSTRGCGLRVVARSAVSGAPMARGFVVVPARTLEKGDVIFRRDDAMNGEAYLVHEGKVEVRKLVDGEERLTN